MKKIIALLLALSMLFALTACGGDNETTPTGESTGETTSTTESTTNTTDGTEDSTQGTTEGTTGTETTEPSTTTPPTTTPPTTPPTTEATHTHSYSSKVTTAATCTAKGVKTYTCSCGNSYTEDIKATGHTWGEWKQTTTPSYTAKGEETRTCGKCSATETRDVAQLTLDNIFKDYPNVILGSEMGTLGFFNSASELQASKIVYRADGLVTPVSTTESPLSYTYSVSSLNAFTNKYLGRTFDYSTAVKDNGSEKIEYNADAQTVTITFVGGMGGMTYTNTYIGYEQIDDTHFVITYETNFEYRPKTAKMEIEKVGNNYIVTSNKWA